MTSLTLESQPEPAHLRRARAALAAVLAGEPDLDTTLAIGAALAVLADVHPPYPPLPDPIEPLAAESGISHARAELARAAATAGHPQEAIRAGLAARELGDF